MIDNAFLDTNTLLGYCILLDPHHKNCKQFIDSNLGSDFFVSKSVEEEYQRKKSTITSRLETGVLNHVREIQQNASAGYLDSIALDSLQSSQIRSDNPANHFLYDYYSILKSGGINKSDLTENLRNLARSIHVIDDLRREHLNHQLLGWIRTSEYPDVANNLSRIHEPDRTHCIDAHDLAFHKNDSTILVSTDVKDIIRNRSLIISETDIVDVKDVSV